MEMVKVVECLLAAGVEPFHTTLKNSTPPLVSAAIQVLYSLQFSYHRKTKFYHFFFKIGK